MSNRYRPDLHNIKGIKWSRILQLVAVAEGIRKIDVATTALATYLESHLDDLVCTFSNPTNKDYPLKEMRQHLKNLQQYNMRDE